MDDILIRGGEVVDGTGAPGRVADVAIRDGRIAAIEENYSGSAETAIDAEGRIVAPGFIDIHTHSDFTLPLNPKAECKIRQGVTTEVLGNCGFSIAPALPGKVDMLRDYLAASAPWLPFEETDFARYMETWPDLSLNTVMQVGHNTLRLMAMGMEDRDPSETRNYGTCRRCWPRRWRRARSASPPASLPRPAATRSRRRCTSWGVW